MWRLYSILSNVEQTLHIVVSVLPRACVQLQHPACYWGMRIWGSAPALMVSWRCLIVQYASVFARDLGPHQWVLWLGGPPLYSFCFFDFSSRKFLLPTSNIRPSWSGFSTSLVSGVAVSRSEPYRGHLGGEGGQKNRNRWWRFSPF